MSEKTYESLDISATGYVVAQGASPLKQACKVIGFIIQPDGTNAATVVLRSGGAAGTVKLRGRSLGTVSKVVLLPVPISFDDGVHITVSGVGMTAVVLYRKLTLA